MIILSISVIRTERPEHCKAHQFPTSGEGWLERRPLNTQTRFEMEFVRENIIPGAEGLNKFSISGCFRTFTLSAGGIERD